MVGFRVTGHIYNYNKIVSCNTYLLDQQTPWSAIAAKIMVIDVSILTLQVKPCSSDVKRHLYESYFLFNCIV